jgi:hypothetical protein
MPIHDARPETTLSATRAQARNQLPEQDLPTMNKKREQPVSPSMILSRNPS